MSDPKVNVLMYISSHLVNYNQLSICKKTDVNTVNHAFSEHNYNDLKLTFLMGSIYKNIVYIEAKSLALSNS